MNIKKKLFSSLVAFLVLILTVSAQQVGSNSPYGRYGFGLLSNPSIGSSEAMGGISYGLRRSQHVNPGNPASYSELDSLTFVFDFGVSGHMARMKDGINKRDYYNGNLDYVAIQFPLFHKIGASVGLLPFSKVGYNFRATKSLSNIQYTETYRGTGGLSRLYGGLSWEINKNLAVGANVSYLFGDINHTSVAVPLNSNATISEKMYEYTVTDMKYDFGVQFTYPINDRKSFTIGAVYSPQVNITSDIKPSERLFRSDPYENPNIGSVQELKTDTLWNEKLQIPHTFGLGVAYKDDNFVVGLDGTYQLWKNSSYPAILDELSDDDRYNDRISVNAGIEYVANRYSPNYFNRIRVRGGLSYSNSYTNMNVYSHKDSQFQGVGSFKEYGVTLGLGLPFHDLRTGHMSMLNITFGYVRQQPDMDYMLSQDMFKISLGMNVNELWFFKRQFQ